MPWHATQETRERQMSVFVSFIDFNKRVCDSIEQILPLSFTRGLLREHELRVAEKMNQMANRTVVDLGGGQKTPFAKHRRPDLATYIIGIDVSEVEIHRNDMLDARIVADLAAMVPLRDLSVDIFATRSVLEHLPRTEELWREVARCLKPGGYFISVLPCRYSPFALINRLLPTNIAKYLLFLFFPKWKDVCGFKAYYADCYSSKIIRAAEASQLDIEFIRYRYYQSIYYKFFIPIYIVSIMYDLLIWLLDAKLLSSQILFVAKKQDPAGSRPSIVE